MLSFTYKSTSNIFWSLCNCLILIDTINGFCLTHGISFPIGQLYKFAILIFLGSQLLKFKRGQWVVILSICYVTLYINHLNININPKLFFESITLLSKFIIVPWVYVYLIHLKNTTDPAFIWEKCIKCFKINSIFICLNIYSGLLGMGSHVYQGSIGYKGYLYAVNEISGLGALLASFFIYFMYIKYHNQTKKFYLFILIIIITTFLLGTKTLLIIIIAGIYYIPSITLFKLRAPKKNRLLKILILLFTLIILIFVGYLFTAQTGMLERWTYFYNQGGIIRIIFSGRNEFWMEEKGEFFTSSFWVQLLGLGEMRTVEMDQFDVLMNYGYLGILIIYSFYGKLLLQTFTRRKRYNISRLIFFINIFLISASCVAGHVIFSGMLGFFWGILNSMFSVPDNIVYDSITSHNKIRINNIHNTISNNSYIK